MNFQEAALTRIQVLSTIGTSKIAQRKRAKGVSTLKELREEAGLTAFDLAVQADVSLSTISRMESGKEAVTRRIANKVLNALNDRLGRKVTVESVDGLKIK